MSEPTENKATPDTDTKVRKPRVKLPELDLGSFASVEIVAPTVIAQRRTTKVSKPRTKQQIAIDQIVTKAHAAWIKAGKPAKWQDRPGAHLVVPETQLASLRAAVYNSCQFLGKRVRFGDIALSAAEVNDKNEVVKPDMADVVFTVTDKPVGSDEVSEDNAK
jgi:hypothetical protein